ncbi:MAG: ATP-binding protein, partial [Rubrivivax sp.]|nr:ATP-binding protein [Rubrivivax sp.]
QLVGMFEQQARQKGLDFHYLPEGPLPAMVRADEKRLRQILLNILGNAVKFTVSGSVTLRLRHQREMAFFSIEDTGPGITPDEVGNIFEPFSRGSAAHVGATGGTGLGLTIARMLTDLMGGELSVSGRPGEGSRFEVRLFLPSIRANQLMKEYPLAPRIGYVGLRRRILVVDNEHVDRELLANILEPLGFQVAQASTGQQCLEDIPRFCPDVIFLDLAMPGLDGWETLRRIRTEGLTDAGIAIISANAFEKGAENDVGISGEDFITKPFRVDELLDWLGKRLNLEWIRTDLPSAAAPSPATPAQRVTPPGPEYRAALSEMIDLGYMRGILKKLDEIEQLDTVHAEFVQVMRVLARRFQFEAMKEILRKSTDASH